YIELIHKLNLLFHAYILAAKSGFSKKNQYFVQKRPKNDENLQILCSPLTFKAPDDIISMIKINSLSRSREAGKVDIECSIMQSRVCIKSGSCREAGFFL
ncbi:MAG: hypothetical protein IKX96_04770, partial [Firmicutes bacterium]|nr:hypothetical protein [Bacillota bacterium]